MNYKDKNGATSTCKLFNEELSHDIDDFFEKKDFTPMVVGLKGGDRLKTDFKQSLKQQLNPIKSVQSLENALLLIRKEIHSVTTALETKRILEELDQSNEHFIQKIQEMIDNPLDEDALQSNSFQTAFGLSNKGIQAFYRLGSQYYQDGRAEEAFDLFSLLLIIAPRVSSHWIAYALALEARGLKDENMQLFYEMAVALNEESVMARYHLIRILMEKNDRNRALAEIAVVRELLANDQKLFDQWNDAVDGLG